MRGERRSRAGCVVTVILVPLGAVVVAVVSALGLYAFLISDAGRRLPGAEHQLDLVRDESITTFVPDGAALIDERESLATKDLFTPNESGSGVVRRFATGDVSATMVAFVDPAIADGWTLVDVSCKRLQITSTISFVKEVPDPDSERANGVAALTLTVSYAPFSGDVEVWVATSRDGPTLRSAIEPVSELLLTGVPRTDPGCLRDRREPPAGSLSDAPATTIQPAWTSAQTCTVVAAAWPEVSVEPTSSEFCVVTVSGYSLNVKAIGTVDPYDYEDERLSTAGGPTMFATTEGGFWVARPDGIALYGTAFYATVAGAEEAMAEDRLLSLAALLAAAPAPA